MSDCSTNEKSEIFNVDSKARITEISRPLSEERGLRPVPSYKLTILKTPIVLSVVAFCLVLIRVVEYACQTLPTETSGSQSFVLPKSSLQRRQVLVTLGPGNGPIALATLSSTSLSVPSISQNANTLQSQPTESATGITAANYPSGPSNTPSGGASADIVIINTRGPGGGSPTSEKSTSHTSSGGAVSATLISECTFDCPKPESPTVILPTYTIPPIAPLTSYLQPTVSTILPLEFLDSVANPVAIGTARTQSTGDPSNYVDPGIKSIYPSVLNSAPIQTFTTAGNLPNGVPSQTSATPAVSLSQKGASQSGLVSTVPNAYGAERLTPTPAAAAIVAPQGIVLTTTDENGNVRITTLPPVINSNVRSVGALTDASGQAFLSTVAPSSTVAAGRLFTTADANGRVFVTSVTQGLSGPIASYTDHRGAVHYSTLLPSRAITPGATITSTDASGNAHVTTLPPAFFTTITLSGDKGRPSTVILASFISKVQTSTDVTGGVLVSTIVKGSPVATSGPNNINRPVKQLANTTYFVASYLPTLIAILLRISIGLIYAATKMLEPFYSLADPTGSGVLVKDFLNVNYLPTNDSFDPLFAMFKGHRLMLFMSILYT
ncbi:MAG: hypothetical protein M1814_005605 [Vezdaea aestivalis]|nr:MAG: hypothetical protein M1814_005605 [Vezdaea aestivalis]